MQCSENISYHEITAGKMEGVDISFYIVVEMMPQHGLGRRGLYAGATHEVEPGELKSLFQELL